MSHVALYIEGSTRWVRRRPLAAAVLLITSLGLLVRLPIAFGAPVFIRKDSASYFLPAWDLAHWSKFDLHFERTPGYPAFLAAVIAGLGEDLFWIALVQHLIGVAAAVGTFWLGAMAFGRGVGLAAGLLAALSGPFLIYEHSIMSETFYTAWLVFGSGALLRGMLTERLRWFAVGSLVLGFAALTRPAGQVVLFALPVALLLTRRSIRAAVVPTLVAGCAFALVLAPWIYATYRQYGVVSTGHKVGEPLISRTVVNDSGFALPDPSADPYTDPRRNEARRLVIEQASKGASASQIEHRVRQDLRLSRPASDAALRDAALEMIRNQPGYYLMGTAGLIVELFVGRHEALELSWTDRRNRAESLVQENWQSVERIRHLVKPATSEQRSMYQSVDWLVNIFQPSRYALALALFFVVGTGASLVRPAWRHGLLVSLVPLMLMLTSTLFDGAQPRYRYPADPFLFTVAMAGGLICLTALRSTASRALSGRRGVQSSRVPAPQS
jgi:4-amino-4-deoxy-L-arabinose transferase-like glycosyltransferase